MTKTKKKKPAVELPEIEIYEMRGAEICSGCGDFLFKSIDVVKMAMCTSCDRMGCAHLVSNAYGTGHCIGKYGCAPEKLKKSST